MKNKMSFLILLLGIIMALSITGCHKEMPSGTFYSLQEAYDSGWLTKEDLQAITNYHNNDISCPDHLSEDIAESIKKDWAQKLRDDNADSAADITGESVVIRYYYGTYQDCVVVIVERIGASYPAIYAPYTIKIGNVTFNYNNPGPQIVVWKF